MAEIWLARQAGLKGFEKIVVIKRMVDALAANQEYIDMFLTEARLAAQLTHPNVVQIYELGEEAGSLYIVMEYLDGEDLASVRRTGQKHGLPLLDHYAVKLISMAAEGLHYAHTRTGLDGRTLGIVHRDISPQNLIVTFDGGLKVVDFGIAKAAESQTNSGKLKGKLAYMSPEQARGEQLDSRSDVFSLGVVLFELVTRTRLLPKMNDLELLNYMASNDPFPLPSSRREDLPAGLEDIIMKALTRKKEQRFHNAREFHEALEGWLRTNGKGVSAVDLADYMRAVFARRIHERRQLIEAAINADLTPSSTRQLTELAARQRGRTGSASKSQSGTGLGTHRTPKTAMIALAALAIVVVGIGIAVVKRVATTDEPAPTPVRRTPPPVAVKPPPSPPVLVIETVPPGAQLYVDGQPRGTSPLTLDTLEAGSHKVEAAVEGYQVATKTISLAEPGVKVMVDLALVPVPAPTPEPTPVATPEPVAKPKPIAAKKPAPVKEAAQGKLTLKTTPWSSVYLGKKKLGDTPLVGVALPAGKHVLRLVNPEAKLENSIEVEILANETTVKKLAF
jgi:serine/threonine-protein kinase